MFSNSIFVNYMALNKTDIVLSSQSTVKDYQIKGIFFLTLKQFICSLQVDRYYQAQFQVTSPKSKFQC